MMNQHRFAVRAIIIRGGKLLLVNAYAPGKGPELWCAPGGGAEAHASLADNLKREVFEETGIGIEVGAPALVNEFHDPAINFHQIEVFFRCNVIAGELNGTWIDKEKIVHTRRFFSRDETRGLAIKPSSLVAVAFGGDGHIVYDPLEPILR